MWTVSSVGRATRLHREGHRFESCTVHIEIEHQMRRLRVRVLYRPPLILPSVYKGLFLDTIIDFLTFMNNETKSFLEELKLRDDVLGVIMFGSWARGNNRTDSDVDLVIILKDGFRRTVEYRDKQAFEIIYTTEKGAFDFWGGHKDDAAGLWEVAKVLYDKDNTIERLQSKIKEVLDAGKKPIDEYQLGQFRFDADDQLKYVESIILKDPTTANLILSNKVFSLIELFFDIRLLWTPAPKQRLAKITELDAKLFELLEQFYKEPITLPEKLAIAREIVPLVFRK